MEYGARGSEPHEGLKTDRSAVKRLPARGHYDRETIYQILDQNFLCHVAFSMEGRPYIIPTAYGRLEDNIYLHGSVKSRMLQHLATGAEACVCVMQVDGIVLARSLFHSSMNYHSVILYGPGQEVTDYDEKMRAFEVITENIWQGRWNEARHPNDGEMKATAVIKIPIVEGGAKIRTGPAKDNKEDYELDFWAGVVPVQMHYGKPESDSLLKEGIALPASLRT